MLTDLARTQRQQGHRLDEIDSRLTEIAGAQLRQGSRLDQIEGRLAGLEERMDRIEETLATIVRLLRER